jgi:hypothetical protein
MRHESPHLRYVIRMTGSGRDSGQHKRAIGRRVPPRPRAMTKFPQARRDQRHLISHANETAGVARATGRSRDDNRGSCMQRPPHALGVKRGSLCEAQLRARDTSPDDSVDLLVRCRCHDGRQPQVCPVESCFLCTLLWLLTVESLRLMTVPCQVKPSAALAQVPVFCRFNAWRIKDRSGDLEPAGFQCLAHARTMGVCAAWHSPPVQLVDAPR